MSRGRDAPVAERGARGVGAPPLGALRGWGRDLFDLLLPGRCLGCSVALPLAPEPGSPARLVCAACLGRLRPPPWPRCPRCHFPLGTGREPSADCLQCRDWPAALASARSAVVLEAPASTLVHAFKYQGWKELAPTLASALLAVPLPAEADGDPSVVVPVPTTRRRRRQRGYDQAVLLARAYAAARGVRFLEALERAGETATQVSLRPDQRRANVRGAFAPTRAAPAVAGAHVLLVDDVLTTGSTAGEAALVLERAGARGVTLVTFARAAPGRGRPAST